MILHAIRSLCLSFAFIVAISATAAHSQPTAPPQVEAAIRSLQRGDHQALRRILAPRLYRIVATSDSVRYADLRALGPVQKVTLRKVDGNRNRVATYDVNVLHEKGTSHWTVRVAAEGQRIIAADFTTDATRPAVVAAPPITPLPAPSPAAPSGGNVDRPAFAPAPPPPIVGTAPPPPMVGAAPPPVAHSAPGPVARSLPSRPRAAMRIDGAPPTARAAPPIGAGATPGGSTPAPPAARNGAPVFPAGQRHRVGCSASDAAASSRRARAPRCAGCSGQHTNGTGASHAFSSGQRGRLPFRDVARARHQPGDGCFFRPALSSAHLWTSFNSYS